VTCSVRRACESRACETHTGALMASPYSYCFCSAGVSRHCWWQSCCVIPLSVCCIAPQERNAAIIRAEGESEAAKLISDATKAAGAGLVELRRIEAAKDIAETMSKSQNVVYLPSGGNMLLGLNPR